MGHLIGSGQGGYPAAGAGGRGGRGVILNSQIQDKYHYYRLGE